MQAYKHIKTNSEFFMLFGMIYADQAWAFLKAKEYDKALALHSHALLYGEHYSFFLDRARTYYCMNDYDKALEDIDRRISLRPSMTSPYPLRAAIYAAKDMLEKANEDFALAETLSPGDAETREWKIAAANRIIVEGHTAAKTNPQQALAICGKALEIDPFSSEALFRKGILYAQLFQLDQAISEFKQAIQYNPHIFDSFKALDHTLATQKRWDEIIGYWHNFLSLEPDNAEVYLEWTGTVHNKGDEQSALADLKRACDLGLQNACSLWRNQSR
jgi:tetratricopeptide (TPR) repeat protein